MQLQVFKYEEENVLEQLTILEINGEAWFVASEVCNLLDIKNVSDAIGSIDEEDKSTSVIPRGSRNVRCNIINESGLYNLIFRSSKPSAKRFKRWVTKEVLPQIRKTGSYGKIDRSALPDFMKRYQLNWANTTKGYFSVIAMLYPTLYATLERVGYSIPDKGLHDKFIRPDVSVGKLFSTYLQKHHPALAHKWIEYNHDFPNGTTFPCRQYENIVLPVFIQFVEDVWIPERASIYFRDKDIKALDYLPKLLERRAA